MFNPRHLLMMSRWARNPPSVARIKFIGAILLFCAVLFVIERYIGWPEALTPNSFKPRF